SYEREDVSSKGMLMLIETSSSEDSCKTSESEQELTAITDNDSKMQRSIELVLFIISTVVNS
ncbi:MAG: hypothetical protein K2I12_00260, partial [Duncaniella sp.]|nr:hypothetical protein [Duncaniella sp.]